MAADNGHVTTQTCDRRMRDLRQDLERDIETAETRGNERLIEHRRTCKGADIGDALWKRVLFILAVLAAAVIGNNVNFMEAFENGNNIQNQTVAPVTDYPADSDPERMQP